MRRVAEALGAATVCALFVVSPWSGARSPQASAAGSTSVKAKANGLVLDAPPSVATPQQPFVARIGLPSGGGRGSASLKLTLYACLGNRSAFDQTLGGSPSGFASSSQTVAVSMLPAEQSGAVDLTVPVRAGANAPTGSGPFVADLDCAQSYFGVYPLRIQLVDDSTSAVKGQLVTYIVYTPSANQQPLQVALVVPLSLGPGSVTAAAGASPSRPVSEAAVSELGSLVDSLSAGEGSRVPVTLQPSPSSLTALAANDETRPKTLPAIQQVAASAGRESLCAPFANVDASELASAGLSGEITQQVRAGAQVLSSTIHSNCSQGSSESSVWVSGGTLDAQALAALGSLGYTRVIVPQSALSGPSSSCNETRLFDLGNTRAASLPAAVVDPGITSHLATASRSDPALGAQQVVAELDQIYFDAPNTSEPRGIVALAPAQWGSNPAFVSDVMSALAEDPIVRPVTLDDFFSQTNGVPVGGAVGGCTLPSLRHPASDGSAGTLPVKGIRSMRTRLGGFASAVGHSTAGALVVEAIDQQLLESEASNASSKQQRADLTSAQKDLDAQLHSISVNAGEIRLASTTAGVPITVVRNLPYPVTAVLAVTSDKLVFPQGSQSPGVPCQAPTVHSSTGRSTYSSLCDISHNTNVVYVHMRTRATGNFRISVTLTSPADGLVLASGELTVRSESFSAVSIGLSAAAAGVLLTWWGRTAWRRRRGLAGRRPAHGRHVKP